MVSPVDQNPYAPPLTEGAMVMPQPANRSQRSMGLLAISIISSMAYVAFTIMLLRSIPPDQKAGHLFVFNFPVLLGLVIVFTRSIRLGMYMGLAAACVQGMIATAMLCLGIGDVSVVLMINGLIILVFLSITAGAWRFSLRP